MEILLVEDNQLNQKVVTFNLRKYNYNVTAVMYGSEAIKLMKERNFDLILMDIMLPEMDGFEITKAIRKYEKEEGISIQIPIIALTANALDNDRDKCYNAGMNEYLSKPFTSDELIGVIDKFFPRQ
ncbi:response regulator [Maribellus comscasis]|uniref:Response regulator n=1 Tax=Maribellus comscasis TaxID=2681766 RepID=A0A6I6K2U1_9BACT|nr:response regulator [Maribellus comscasis]QGY44234.1 response regulator [Maribellus comscasis]